MKSPLPVGFAAAAALAACLSCACARREEAPPPPPRVEVLTSGAAYDGEADVSPDSSFVVFVSTRDGARGLYRLDVASGEVRRLAEAVRPAPAYEPGGTAAGPNPPRIEPAISSTGRVAYVHAGRLGICTLDGSDVRDFEGIPGGSSPTWSPDGKFVLCVAQDGAFMLADVEAGSVIPAEWLLPEGATDPMWAADGTVVFSAGPPGHHDIYALDPSKSGPPRPLTNTDWDERSPYLRDGLLAFTANPDGAYRPYALRMDAPAGTAPERLGPARTEALDPVVWPGGESVLVSESGGCSIRFRAAAGGAISIAVPADADHRDPVFDAEARNVFYTSNADGNDDIYVVDLGDSNVANLTTSLEPDEAPDFSPATHRVVFVATRDGDSKIATLDESGLDETLIAESPAHDVEPSFSPDGTRVAFASDRAGTYDIWTVEASGGEPVQVSTTPYRGNERHPTWVDGGRALVFSADWVPGSAPGNLGEIIPGPPPKPGLARVDLESGAVTKLTSKRDTGAADTNPTANTDGTKVIFTRTANDNADLWVLDLASGEAAPAVTDPETNLDNGSWSRDGATIAFQSGYARNLVRYYPGAGPARR